MAADPRKFLVKNCGPAITKVKEKDAQAGSFFGAVGAAGELEVWNEVGAGGVGEGLRSLESTENIVSNTFDNGGSDDLAADRVLEAVGSSRADANAVAGFNPDVANRAMGSAKGIAQRVKQGNFRARDVPQAAADLKNMKQLAEGIFTPEDGNKQADIEVCQASPYAMDLIRYAPKQKFLFVVEFKFNTGYEALSNLEFPFVIKNSTRPNISFEWEEVNMYNFRTKVLTKTNFEPMQMEFYDDRQDNITWFFDTLMKAHVPITNMDEPANKSYEDTTLNFERLGLTHGYYGIPTHDYASSTGPLVNDNKTMIDEIRLFHVGGAGKYMNVYKFFNPKITSMEMDGLDMATTDDGTSMSLEFTYDSVHLVPKVSMDPVKNGQYNTRDLTNAGLYPMRYLGPMEVGLGSPDSQTEGTPTNQENQGQDGGGFFDSITGAATDAWGDAKEYAGNAWEGVTSSVGGMFSSEGNPGGGGNSGDAAPEGMTKTATGGYSSGVGGNNEGGA